MPLSAIAQIEEQTAPLEVEHLGQFPSTTVSFNLAPGASLGAAVDAIKQAEAEIGMPTQHDHRDSRAPHWRSRRPSATS